MLKVFLNMQERFVKYLNEMRDDAEKAQELLEVYNGYNQLSQAIKLGIKMNDPFVQAQLAILRQRVRIMILGETTFVAWLPMTLKSFYIWIFSFTLTQDRLF